MRSPLFPRHAASHAATLAAINTLLGQLALGPVCGAVYAAEVAAPAQRVEIQGQAPLPGGAATLGFSQGATAADLRDSQALDLSEHLARRFVGVQITENQGNPLQSDLNFRGFTASPLLGTPQGLAVVMDGVRLNQPFGDVVSWDLIPRNALATVQLLSGSQPLFGLNALGGALVLTTKDGRSDPGGELSVQAGSAGRRVLEGSLGRVLSPSTDLFLAGQVFQEDGWREASPSRQNQLFGKLGWRDGSSSLKLSLAHADTDLTGNGLQDQRFLESNWSSVFSHPDNTRNQATLLNLVGTKSISDQLQLSGNLYARRLKSHTLNGDVNEGALDQNLYFNPTVTNLATLSAVGFSGMPSARETPANTLFPYWNCLLNASTNEEPNDTCTGLLNRSSTAQTAWGLGLQAAWQTELAGQRHQLVGGLAWEASRVRFQQSAEFGYITPDHGVTGVGVFANGSQDSEDAFDARTELSNRNQTLSLYATDTWTLSPVIQLSLGGRWNRSTVRMVDELDPTGTTGTLNARHHFSRFNPALTLATALAPQVKAHLSLGASSRAPTATELGCADPADPCRLPNAMASDPPLKMVVTRSVEAGLRGGDSRWRWTAAAFRADNRNDILFVASETAGTGYFRNVDRTRRQGLELGTDARVGVFTLGAQASWLQASFQSEETLLGAGNSANDQALDGKPGLGEGGLIHVMPGKRLPMLPDRLFKAHAQARLAGGWTLGAEWLGVGSSYARGNENNLHQPDGNLYLGSGRNPGYGLVNASLSWDFAPAWTLSAKINNLLDKRYSSGAVLGATPFNATGGLDARQLGSYVEYDGSRSYAVRQTTFKAPGAPRQGFISLAYRFD